jgi:two-component system LytT family response regulator
MLQVLIVDDEAHMRDSLTKLLARHCPQVAVVGEAGSVETGIKVIRELHPDIVLLDIQLEDGTGFDILNAFQAMDFKVIFVTAYDQYAVQAFRFSAVDYLLKPVNPEMLAEAVGRAAQLIREHQNIQIQALQENLKNIGYQNKKIILKTTENIYLLELHSIICCESDDNYTKVHTLEGDKILVSKTLKEYDDMLNGCGFYRVHKSYLINLAHIKRFEKQEGGYIILTGDLKIPVASRKRDEMLALLERMAE